MVPQIKESMTHTPKLHLYVLMVMWNEKVLLSLLVEVERTPLCYLYKAKYKGTYLHYQIKWKWSEGVNWSTLPTLLLGCQYFGKSKSSHLEGKQWWHLSNSLLHRNILNLYVIAWMKLHEKNYHYHY